MKKVNVFYADFSKKTSHALWNRRRITSSQTDIYMVVWKRAPCNKKTQKEKLPVVITRHESLLLRKLGNADMRLQYNKVKNLRIASSRMTHMVIAPGETFSLRRSTLHLW